MKNKILGQSSGFTLVELLVTIVILGMLILLAGNTILGSIERTEERAYDILIKTIETSAELYITEHAHEYLEIDVPLNEVEIYLQDLVNDGYISPPIHNPSTGKTINPTATRIVISIIGITIIDNIEIHVVDES